MKIERIKYPHGFEFKCKFFNATKENMETKIFRVGDLLFFSKSFIWTPPGIGVVVLGPGSEDRQIVGFALGIKQINEYHIAYFLGGSCQDT